MTPIDANTILIANDNNFPFTGGRNAVLMDYNDLALIRLDQPLNLGPSLTLSVSVPEPASMTLLASLLGLAGVLRRRGRYQGSRRVK